MAQQSYAEEQTKIAREAKFATLGRAIADTIAAGGSAQVLIQEAALRRQQEQESADKLTQFAALTRQIGDAYRQQRSLEPLIHAVIELRKRELGPPRP